MGSEKKGGGGGECVCVCVCVLSFFSCLVDRWGGHQTIVVIASNSV